MVNESTYCWIPFIVLLMHKKKFMLYICWTLLSVLYSKFYYSFSPLFLRKIYTVRVTKGIYIEYLYALFAVHLITKMLVFDKEKTADRNFFFCFCSLQKKKIKKNFYKKFFFVFFSCGKKAYKEIVFKLTLFSVFFFFLIWSIFNNSLTIYALSNDLWNLSNAHCRVFFFFRFYYYFILFFFTCNK